MADVVVQWKQGDNSANIQKAIDSGDPNIIIPRPGLFANKIAKKDGFTNISGTIKVKNPNQQPSDLGNNLTNVTLEFTK